MAGTNIAGLTDNSVPASTDLIHLQKGASDFKETLADLSTFFKADLTPAEVLAKLLQVDINTSTLNANFLQGQDSSFYKDGASVETGTVNGDRLPNGASVVSGGGVNWSHKLEIPPFIFGGERILIQFGMTPVITPNNNTTVTYPQTFVSGFGSSDIPLFIVTPLSTYGGDFGSRRVEVDMRAYTIGRSSAQVSSIRVDGSGPDNAQGCWLAIGKY